MNAQLAEALEDLPPEALDELLDFVRYLQHKYGAKRSGPVAKLGGLWAEICFDVSHEDVRNLRRQVSTQLLNKV